MWKEVRRSGRSGPSDSSEEAAGRLFLVDEGQVTTSSEQAIDFIEHLSYNLACDSFHHSASVRSPYTWALVLCFFFLLLFRGAVKWGSSGPSRGRAEPRERAYSLLAAPRFPERDGRHGLQ